MMSDQSLAASLARLGIQFGKRQIIALVASTLAGLIVAYGMPYIYSPVVGSAMDQIGQCTGCWRDTINKYLMTVLTMGVSFLIAFRISRSTRW